MAHVEITYNTPDKDGLFMAVSIDEPMHHVINDAFGLLPDDVHAVKLMASE